ncbi:MAG: zinc-binding dehydrogenase [Sumerlaeia bacterium]
MKAIIAHRSGEPRLVELDIPPAGKRNVIVRVTHLALQLPDEHLFLKSVGKTVSDDVDGLPLGSLCSGIIESVGPEVRRLREGLRIAAFSQPYVYHAQYLSVPETNCIELPKRVSHEEGSFTGIGISALNLFRRSECQIGSKLIIFGAGMLGILLAQIAISAGVHPVVVDLDESKRTKARNVGVQDLHSINLKEITSHIMQLTNGLGVDTMIYTLDSPPSCENWPLELLRDQGKIMLTNRNLASPNSKTLAETRCVLTYDNGSPTETNDPRWTKLENAQVFLDLLSERKVQVTPLVTERTPLDRAISLYEKIQRTGFTTVGAVLTC